MVIFKKYTLYNIIYFQNKTEILIILKNKGKLAF